jgi:hypothetical protein
LLKAVWPEKAVGIALSEFDTEPEVRETGLSPLGALVEYVLLRVGEGVI